MGILNEIASKAKDLIQGNNLLNRRTRSYDASKNRIVVAGFELDGVVEATLSAKTVAKSDQGVSKYYYTYYEVHEPLTLNITVLPTAKCNEILQLLAYTQNKKKGWFTTYIVENGVPVDVYKSVFLNLSEIGMQAEGQNRTYVLGICDANNNTVEQTESVIGEETPLETSLDTPVAIVPE
ncbi:TPA: hypothetical protein NNW70_004172 [Salmonella enterica]|nr:hypothetical protein [Salmonella enterica]HCH9607882.1 hypothetical protein [Salmonella enterica]HDI5000176.1 hypothetical protein [Salmonella enterica]